MHLRMCVCVSPYVQTVKCVSTILNVRLKEPRELTPQNATQSRSRRLSKRHRILSVICYLGVEDARKTRQMSRRKERERKGKNEEGRRPGRSTSLSARRRHPGLHFVPGEDGRDRRSAAGKAFH